MKVTFYTRSIQENQKEAFIQKQGQAELIEGKVVFTPPQLETTIKGVRNVKGLTTKDGEEYLEILPRVFAGAYFYAVLET